MDEEGKMLPQGVDYGKLTPILIKAVQEQDLKIKTQDLQLKEQQNQIQKLIERIEQLEAKR